MQSIIYARVSAPALALTQEEVREEEKIKGEKTASLVNRAPELVIFAVNRTCLDNCSDYHHCINETHEESTYYVTHRRKKEIAVEETW